MVRIGSGSRLYVLADGDNDGPVYPRGLAELLTRDGPPERCGAAVVLGPRAIQPSPRFAGSPRR